MDHLRGNLLDNEGQTRFEGLEITIETRTASETEVAELLDVDPRSIRNLAEPVPHGRPECPLDLEHKGDKGELTEEQQRQLKDEIQTGRFRTVKHVRQRIEQTFALAYSESGAKRLLQRLGCTSHKASGSCFKARRDKQRGVAPEVRGTQGPGRRDLASLLPRRRPTTVGAGVALQLLAAPWAASESAERQWPQTAEHLGGICPDDHEYLDRRNVKRNLTARSVIRPV